MCRGRNIFDILLWSTPFQKDHLLVFFKWWSLFTYIHTYKEGIKLQKKFFRFSECEFHLMRFFSCHADCINWGMTVLKFLFFKILKLKFLAGSTLMSRSHVHFEIELPLYLIYIYWNRYVGTLSRNMRALCLMIKWPTFFIYK